MTLRTIGALTRASWYEAKSYRVRLVMQVASILMTVLPLFFIANALQDMMARSIAVESDQYFSFLLVGTVAFMFFGVALSGLQSTIGGAISTGYFETLLMTRAPLSAVLGGLSTYTLLLTGVRAAVMVITGWLLGAHIAWLQIAPATFILALVVAVHWGIGLIGSALMIAFRTAGPLNAIVSTTSVLFGGVYYPVSSIPSWLRSIADVTPLAYGLRALRRVLLQGESLGAVSTDVAILAAMTVLSLMAGAWAMRVALNYAKRAGTLSSY